MSDIAIKAENVSKLYQLGEFTTGSLNKDLERWWAKLRGKEDPFLTIGEANDRSTKGKSNVVWSLKDVSFDIKKGDAVGVIGRNGAGKSTLLKILTKVTSPTTGRITGEGRIASLLEVGTGFHPELTGRENIYLNGAILGMKKWEIKKKFDEMVDFSGIERYIDTPVKRYSSGMYVRLAFAVAAHLESEILIVDEVLAVGDAEFQKKCLGKMNSVSKSEGRTVLFVSHHMSSIRALCNTGLYLKNGSLVKAGTMPDIIEAYFNEGKNRCNKEIWTGNNGNNKIRLYKCHVYPGGNESEYTTSDDLIIEMEGEVLKPTLGLIVGFTLWSEHDYELAYVLHDDKEEAIKTIEPHAFKKLFKIPAHTLAAGKYRVEFDVGIQFVQRIIHDDCDVFFTLINVDGIGRKFAAEGRGRTGLFRPDWSANA
jgi:lipopolysaccharide transport system ATP-binding protein